jgi:ATP-binding cassette subfamily B protein
MLPKRNSTCVGFFLHGFGYFAVDFLAADVCLNSVSPSLLILDDSFSAVDSETENRILKYLSSIENKPTIFLISHKFSSLKRADIIYFMENGRITESGKHEELIETKGNYYNMFFRQEIESEIERL